MMAEKLFELSLHTQEVKTERRIAERWVPQVIENPATIELARFDPSLTHAFGPIQEFDSRILRVIYNHRVESMADS